MTDNGLFVQFLIYHISCKRAGFWSAMASNVTNQSRNVLSKKVMVKKEVTTTDVYFRLPLLLLLAVVLIWNSCSTSNGGENICGNGESNNILFLKQDSIDNITLFSIITVMSFFLLSPVAIFMEGVKFTPAYLQSAVSNSISKLQSKFPLFLYLDLQCNFCHYRDWTWINYTLGLFLLPFVSMLTNR